MSEQEKMDVKLLGIVTLVLFFIGFLVGRASVEKKLIYVFPGECIDKTNLTPVKERK